MTTATPLTIDEMRAADADREERTITEATRSGDGWSIIASGWGVFLQDKNNPRAVEPKVGDALTVYGRIGQPFYGMDLNGENIYWLTPLEREAERATWLAKYDREKRERYARERDALEATVAALPPPLRKRIERFRLDTPDEERLTEGYEIYCCAQAAVIADVIQREKPMLEPEAAVKWFRDLPYAEQIARGLDDGHSGNTFGGACQLAYRVLSGLEC